MADSAAALASVASSSTAAAAESSAATPAAAGAGAAASASPATSTSPATTSAGAAAAPMPTCMQLLGATPTVDSTAALHSFASQLHVLTTPLPSSQSEAQLAALEELAMGSLERLDEFSALVEALKHGAAQADGQVLPLILSAQSQLAPLFQRVHTFAKYAHALDAQMSAVEKRVGEVDSVLRRTAAMEAEYARNRPTIARDANGVTHKQESSAKKLFSSLLGLGNKPGTGTASSAATGSGAASTGAAASVSDPSGGAPSVLDLMDEWKPFDTTMQVVDIDEWFAAQ